MLRVIARSTYKDGTIDDVIKILEKMVEETRKESGCIAYDLCQDTENPNVLTFMEAWESKAHLDAHMQTEHFKTIIPQAGEFRVGPPEISVYTQVI